MTAPLTGHRRLRLGIGPFAGVAPALLLAGAWFAAAVARGLVPTSGGRWAVVHLFTLGVLSNLLVAFTQHFARSVTRSDRALGLRHLVLLNAGVVALLAGMLVRSTPLIGGGSATVAAVVLLARVRLARMRREASTSRFTWVVRGYERAHEAFLAAAVLGAAMGLGLVPGSWYAAVRLSHLHLNVLGWAGLVVLATVVLFGPALLRVRLPEGAERRTARALGAGALGLLVAAVALVLSAAPGPAGTLLRLVAAAGLAVYAWPVASVTRTVVGMARAAHPCAARPLLPAAMAWFAVAVLADVVAVAGGAHATATAIGLAVGVGVVLQLVLAVALYLLPSLRGRDFAARDLLIARTERGAVARAVAFNAAMIVVVAAALGTVPVPLVGAATAGAWAVLLAVIASTVVLAALPVRADPTRAHSTVARRYRAPQPQH